MNHLPLIIEREYLTKVRNKSFIIMTFLSPFIFVGIFGLVAYLSSLNSDTVRYISVLDESGLFLDEFVSSPHTKYNILHGISLEEAKKEAETKQIYGLLYIPNAENLDVLSKKITFYSEDSPSMSMMSDINKMLENKVNTLKLKEAGIDSEIIKSLRINISANQETFKGQETSKLGAGLKLVFGGAAGYLLFMFIIIYGNMIMRSVIEEKTSRVIEVIISSVKPRVLLLGKIIGTSLAGITQFIIWIFIGGILITILSVVFGVETQTPQQELVHQTMANPELGVQVQDLVTAFYNLPLLNLVIAFIL